MGADAPPVRLQKRKKETKNRMSVIFQPLPAGEKAGTDFEVWADGVPLPLHTAYVSAIPFNRRWPGHQRESWQREEINFAAFAMDAPVTFEVRPKRPFEQVVLRPMSLHITPEVNGDCICFTLPRPAYFTLELDGPRQALHLFADPIADYGGAPTAPDTLYFGPGLHEAGVIELHSGQTLYLADGAVVFGSVRARDAENIRILGRGILDNSHNVETILAPVDPDAECDWTTAVTNAIRTHTIELTNCRNIEIDGIVIRDSLVYNIRPVACDHLNIRRVKIIGSWRYNSDGIDMHNCTDVHISDCFIRTFDDCICAKGFDGMEDPAARNGHMVFDSLTVERCVLWNDWNCTLEIGAETFAEEICHITWRDCDIIHATHSFLDGQNVDQANVHDWLIENIRCEYDHPAQTPAFQEKDSTPYAPHYESGYAPLLFSVTITKHHEYSQSGERRGRFYGITVRNIRTNAEKPPLVRLCGYDADHLCEDVTIDGIYANGRRLSKDELALTCNEFTRNIRIL